MAENRGNNQQDNFTYNPQWDNFQGTQTERDIHIIAQVLANNPNFLKNNFQSSRESQSNYSENKWKIKHDTVSQYRSRGNLLEDFEAGIKDQLLDSLAGGDFKKAMQGALTQFSKEFGFDLRNIGHEFGKELSGKAFEAVKKSGLGQQLQKNIGKWGDSLLTKAFGKQGEAGQAAIKSIKNVIGAFKNSGQGGLGNLAGLASKGGSGVASVAGKGLANVASSGGAQALAGKGATVLAKGAASLGPWGLLIAGVIFTIVKVLGPALKGLAEVVTSLGKSFNREEELRKKRMENAQKRMQADMEWMAKKPFEILQEATEKWTSAWDSNLRTIGQTQGYDKESVYALYEGYATKLRKDNLDAVISATDVIDKLSSVLESGLSGEVAERFAYIATKLSAAVPGQDFFSYADTYASIAANEIALGKSHAEALNAADTQLEQFASDLLYSSRELAGGFSTGLKNSAALFKDAVQIAQAAKTNNSAYISGTLTSVSAIVGAVAPDLADALVNNVVQAAIGGNNNSQLVALRSLAGVNAGNTEFLRALAEDPKKIFSALFTNLASMQSMSPANYMEVAEGLADVFGIDKGAFARVDFKYLADNIEAMQTNMQSLSENMALLQSGQTTTSAEQLKAQEINRVILDEGLAYVIDNEAGRMIQQHMWDEQIANELANNEYAVSLQGAALAFLEGIRKSMTTLLNFLNPVGFINKGIANLTQTVAESFGNENDIKEILRLGAVGGNATAYSNLTTRGKDLQLTTSLVEMMGGEKGIASLNKLSKFVRNYGNVASNILTGSLSADQFNYINDNTKIDWSSPVSALISAIATSGSGDDIRSGNLAKISRYKWGAVGKSFAQAYQSTSMNSKTLGSIINATTSATQLAQDASNKRFEEFLATAEEAAANNMSYEAWVGTASSRGISNFSDALDAFGRTEDELRSYFEAQEARQGAIREQAKTEDEQKFRDEARAFWDFTSGSSGVFQTAMWLPFFGAGQKYDTRMDSVDLALSDIQTRIGRAEKHTVIGGIEEVSDKLGTEGYTVLEILGRIEGDISNTFISTSSAFQRCLADWLRYKAESANYTNTITKSAAWSDLKSAERDQQAQASLALAKALEVFSADELQKMDPQLQANVLLGKILVVLQAIMQQNNTQAGGLSLIDTISALGLGITK